MIYIKDRREEGGGLKTCIVLVLCTFPNSINRVTLVKQNCTLDTGRVCIVWIFNSWRHKIGDLEKWPVDELITVKTLNMWTRGFLDIFAIWTPFHSYSWTDVYSKQSNTTWSATSRNVPAKYHLHTSSGYQNHENCNKVTFGTIFV